jgi:hypothetical protein
MPQAPCRAGDYAPASRHPMQHAALYIYKAILFNLSYTRLRLTNYNVLRPPNLRNHHLLSPQQPSARALVVSELPAHATPVSISHTRAPWELIKNSR